jgi:16S rRNA (adenine1518-N6/adenine1519-N6)-dimethyltransferase
MNAPLTLKEQIVARMEELDIHHAKKSLGQNFLISSYIVNKIVDAVKQLNPLFVVEVGPGLGSLTDTLGLYFKNTLLIEMDSKFSNYWQKHGHKVVEVDALRWNWNDFEFPTQTCLVSNLPYQISSRIVIDRSQGPNSIESMVLMFQKEVAERICAKPRTADYGFLTLAAQAFWEVSEVVDASPADFFPSPKVQSRVLRFRRRKDGPDAGFVAFSKQAFTNRRKLFIKNFSDNKDKMLLIMNNLGLNDKSRAEEIPLELYLKIYNQWKQ